MIIKFKDGTEKELSELKHADLRGANFQDANLRGANFEYADLRGADFKHADLQSADLQGADIQGADIQGANLQGANLRYADLQRANLRYADLQRADIRGANLDFSCLSLCCRSFDTKVDIDFAKQILYHVSRLDFEDNEGIKDAIRVFSNSASVIKRHGLSKV